LISPKEKRDEIKQIRKLMDEYQDYKQDHNFLSRRERQIKNGWRHGITGLFDA